MSLADTTLASPGVAPSNACEAQACTTFTAGNDHVLPEAQRRWAARPITERLQSIRAARHWIADHPEVFARAISPDLARSQADTLVTELLPLLEAMRFLERNAQKLLAPRRLGRKHRPLWLAGVQAEVHRDPLGHILVIGPANFPLFLPGVQALQALVAGNAVTWKPGTGGGKVAQLLAHVLREAGLPRGILHITDDTAEAGQTALARHPDKVIFTGSYDTGRHILRSLAETATPAVLELSGADAVVVLPSADLSLVAKAIAFGLRLNGAEVCMSPRRLVATREALNSLRPLLVTELAKMPAVPLKSQTADLLRKLLTKARGQGAIALTTADSRLEDSTLNNSQLIAEQHPSTLNNSQLIAEQHPSTLNTSQLIAEQHLSTLNTSHLTPEQHPSASTIEDQDRIRPVLLDHVTPDMPVTRADLFAPVLSLIEAPSVLHLADLVNNNPYGLTAAIFGAPAEAQTLATQLRVGTVLINDLIAPTADPRVPFGGRGHSGFGVTRGGEGLLEMTAVKTILLRRKGLTRHYDPLGHKDTPLFAGLIGALHGATLATRWRAAKQLINAARNRTKH